MTPCSEPFLRPPSIKISVASAAGVLIVHGAVAEDNNQFYQLTPLFDVDDRIGVYGRNTACLKI